MSKREIHIKLSEEADKLLQQYKAENGIKTDGAAITHLLMASENNKRIAIAVREELENNYMQKERLKWGVQTAEQNSIIMLDAINTMLHMLKAEACISTELAEHQVISQSRAKLKERIAYFKQKSDERKSKGKV